MQQDMISYRWEPFKNNVASSLRDLLTNTSSFDVTLVSDDQIHFQAHKFVLGACSPVLKNLLLNNSHSHPLIYLRGVEHQELWSILQFMYRGETGVQQQRIQTLLNNVKDFQIKPLALDNIDDEEFYNNEVIDTKLDILITIKMLQTV